MCIYEIRAHKEASAMINKCSVVQDTVVQGVVQAAGGMRGAMRIR